MSWIPFHPRASKHFININFPNQSVRLECKYPFPPVCLNTGNTGLIRNWFQKQILCRLAFQSQVSSNLFSFMSFESFILLYPIPAIERPAMEANDYSAPSRCQTLHSRSDFQTSLHLQNSEESSAKALKHPRVGFAPQKLNLEPAGE